MIQALESPPINSGGAVVVCSLAVAKKLFLNANGLTERNLLADRRHHQKIKKKQLFREQFKLSHVLCTFASTAGTQRFFVSV